MGIAVVATPERHGPELLGESLVQPDLLVPSDVNMGVPPYPGHEYWALHTVERAYRGDYLL